MFRDINSEINCFTFRKKRPKKKKLSKYLIAVDYSQNIDLDFQFELNFFNSMLQIMLRTCFGKFLIK